MLIVIHINNPARTERQYRDDVKIRDSLYRSQLNNRLDEMRTRFEVEKITAEKERNRNYYLFSLAGCLLLAMLLGFYVYHNRRITAINRNLYRKIKEQDRLMQELDDLSKQIDPDDEADTAHSTRPDDACTTGGQPPPAHPAVAGQQRQIVARLHKFLLNDRNFARNDIDLQELAFETATNKSSLFDALKAVTGKTPMDYINQLRLDEAKQRLDDSTFTIETCGFNTYRTFHRRFRDHYGISPSDYRKMAQMESL